MGKLSSDSGLNNALKIFKKVFTAISSYTTQFMIINAHFLIISEIEMRQGQQHSLFRALIIILSRSLGQRFNRLVMIKL